ncbi:hypothetical protein Btru_013507 [Bulinus truncatus]|nr:hypothetical protein Btru_013507 [Bulinus truncatus]
MAALLLLTSLLIAVVSSVVLPQTGYGEYFNSSYYDAAYDFTTGLTRDSPPTITRFQSYGGSGCSTRIVLKMTFSKKVTNQRLLIDLFFTSPTGFTFNLGDSSTNNGFAGDASTQSRDAELQLLNGRLDGFRSDFGGSGPAFNLTAPSKFLEQFRPTQLNEPMRQISNVE